MIAESSSPSVTSLPRSLPEVSTVPGEGHGRRGPVQPFVDEIQASTAGGFWPFGKPPAKVWGLHQIGSTSHEPSPRPETARRQRSCEASWQTQPPEHRNRSLPGSINVTENGSEIAGDACEVSTACSQSRTPPRGRVAVFSVGRRLIPARPRWAEPL